MGFLLQARDVLYYPDDFYSMSGGFIKGESWMGLYLKAFAVFLFAVRLFAVAPPAMRGSGCDLGYLFRECLDSQTTAQPCSVD
jgi:hypothetical protein